MAWSQTMPGFHRKQTPCGMKSDVNSLAKNSLMVGHPVLLVCPTTIRNGSELAHAQGGPSKTLNACQCKVLFCINDQKTRGFPPKEAAIRGLRGLGTPPPGPRRRRA